MHRTATWLALPILTLLLAGCSIGGGTKVVTKTVTTDAQPSTTATATTTTGTTTGSTTTGTTATDAVSEQQQIGRDRARVQEIEYVIRHSFAKSKVPASCFQVTSNVSTVDGTWATASVQPANDDCGGRMGNGDFLMHDTGTTWTIVETYSTMPCTTKLPTAVRRELYGTTDCRA